MLLLWQEFSLQPCKDKSIPISLFSLSSSLPFLATARIHTNINVLEDSANTFSPPRNIAQAVSGPATPVVRDSVGQKLPNYLPYPQYQTSFTAHSHHCSITYRMKPLSKISITGGKSTCTLPTDSASKEPSLTHNKDPAIHSYTKNHHQLHHILSSKFAYS